MTALVTGATGFLGSALARRLLDGGERVRVLARSDERARALAERGAEVVVGDITDVTALAKAVSGAELVYHLAGRLLEPGVDTAEYWRTHVAGTELLLERCRRSPALQRFVHVSTTGVLGPTGVRPADESAPLQPSNVYESTKAEAELAVRRASRVWLPVVIARPGLVYGPGDLHLLGFFRAVLSRRFRPIGRRTVWLHPIYIDDMVEALVRCGACENASGECFHLAGRDPVRLDELASAVAAAAGTRAPAGRIPLPVARALAAAGDRLPASLRRRAPLTRSRLEFLTHSRVYDVTKARRLLGFEATTDLLAGTRLSMAWYRAHGHLPAGA